MKQALHIFRKDARRLWLQVLVVCGMFGLLVRTSQDSNGLGSFETTMALVLIACGVLIASAIQEDAPAQESPFWLTRPYRRMSLLGAKLLLVFAFVFLPLLLSGIVIEARSGVNITANGGTLILLDLAASLWLILPAFALGVVTRNMKAFAGGALILLVMYFGVERWVRVAFFPMVSINPIPLVLGAIVVIGVQYRFRRTEWSGAILATAAAASAFLVPLNGMEVLSPHATHPRFDPSQVQITFDETAPPVYDSRPGGPCFRVPLKVAGLPEGAVLQVLRQNPQVRERTIGTIGTIVPISSGVEYPGDGYREFFCAPGVLNSPEPESLSVSMDIGVFATDEIAKMPVKHGVLQAGNAGRCQIFTPELTGGPRLRCNLENPADGSIQAGLEYPGYKSWSDGFLFHREPLSPVSLYQFDGDSYDSPGGWPFEEALGRPDAHFLLREERVIGTLHRDLVYRELRFPWTRTPSKP